MELISQQRHYAGKTILVFSILILILSIQASSNDPSTPPRMDDLLMAGHYNEIAKGDDAHGLAVWAFARYFLAPDNEAVDAAKKAHEKGDPLGSYVLLRAQCDGMCVRHNESYLYELNYNLREGLLQLSNPTALEKYILSHTLPGDKNGLVTTTLSKDGAADFDKPYRQRWNWLLDSANGGFAQAMDEVGKAYQSGRDYNKAIEWYIKAADQGLASGMNDAGYLLLTGPEADKEKQRGLDFNLAAEEKDDVHAMINLGVFYWKGTIVEKDLEKAQYWIDKAAISGHFHGLLEKGLALLVGNYGYTVDKSKGMDLLRSAISTRNGDVLFLIADMYHSGRGLDKNMKKAIQFAEAAFVQGNGTAASLLSKIYKNGGNGIEPNKRLAQYWALESNVELAFAFGADTQYPEMRKYLDQLDPWSVALE